jgi:hypothetical protein
LSFFKKLLPVAGAAAGFLLTGPGGAVALNSALGSGIGTLLAGGDVNDAIKNAALAGAAGYALGPQGMGLAGGATQEAVKQGVTSNLASGATAATAGGASEAALYGQAMAPTATQVASKGIMSAIAEKPLLAAGLGAGALGLLSEEPGIPELTELQKAQFETGERLPYYEGQPVVRRYDYQNSRQPGVVYAAEGGYIQGPGTGRSDDVKAGIFQDGMKVQEARLSDGEFVMTERAVRGLGNGDRSQGAAKMYEMMRQYERMA